jgi:hypothetical protein
MNFPLERLGERVIPFIAIVAGIGLALIGGKLAAQGQFSTIGFIAISLITLALVIKLNTRVWMIMFLAWSLTGRIGFLEIPFTLRELFALVALLASFVMIAFKMIRGRARFGGLDAVLWINLFYMATVFIRNPVGLDVFNAERVGGRDYFDVGIACSAYFVLSRTTATPGQARKLPLFMAFSTGVVGVLSVITYFKPSLFPILGTLYSGIYSGSYQAGDVQAAQWMGETNSDRINTLLYFAQTGFLCLCSFYRSVTLINPFYFGRFCMMLVCAAATMFAGFRSILFYNAIIFFLSSYFRGQLRQTATILLLSIPLLLIILVGQGRMFELPNPAQRALSFLPGNWKYEVVQDAKGSTDWRVEMWKRALTSDRYIENKLLGDGFGFRQLDMQRLERLSANGASYEATQEKMMLSGAYHSGPVSAIRYVGAVGLILYYIFIIALAIYAKRLIRSCWKTPFFVPALFFCMPVFFHPFFFTFIFGGYAPDLIDSIFALGCLKMIERSLAVYREKLREDARGTLTLETTDFPGRFRESLNEHAHAKIST